MRRRVCERRPSPSPKTAIKFKKKIVEYFFENVTVKISERQKQILDIVKGNPNVLQTELAERFGVRRETIYRDMKKLVDAGILSRSDSDKKCTWKVVKKIA